MRLRASLLALVLILLPAPLLAQDDPGDAPLGNLGQGMPVGGFGAAGANQFTSAAGVTVIDDEAYVTLRLQPELAIGKFGLGLDVPLMVSLQGDGFRSEEFTDGVGVLRMIRYLRWGQKKRDPLYFKVGDLTGATMGFGFIMYQYSNVGSFEKRPIGAEVDVNFDQTYGVEALYSDFSETGVMGARPYVRPLRAAGLDLPLLRNLEVGLLYVTDRSDRAVGFRAQDSLQFVDDATVSAWGADVGLPIRLGSIVSIVPYAAFASLSADADSLVSPSGEPFEPGSGAALGVNFGFDFVADVLQVHAKLERRFYGEHFTGSYFNGSYESAKLGGTPPISRLARAEESYGIFGALYGHVINKVILGGSLAIPDQISRTEDGRVTDGAYLHMEAAAPDLIPKMFVRATYNRDYIADLSDAFQLDENSNLEMRVGYKLNPFLLVGTDYRWTFVEVEDEQGNEQIEVNNYVFPFVALQFDLPFGG